AEDGIRDLIVTGVQTCALPISLIFDRVTDGLGSGYLYTLKPGGETWLSGPHGNFILPRQLDRELVLIARYTGLVPIRCMLKQLRSEERRVGKECRSWW